MENFIKKIKADFPKEIEKVFKIAKKSDSQKDKEWDKLLIEYEIKPLSSEERTKIIERGLSIKKGALPSELRLLLEKIRNKYIFLVDKFDDDLLEDEVSRKDLDNFRYQILENFIENKIKEYINQIKEPVALNTIFANASKSIGRIAQLQEAKLYTIKCKTCGAARLEEDQYNHCSYCGSQVFDKVKK